ncbi:MAG: phosphatidate cytidylyltransferase [Elusimicrobiota bacterium]
MQKSNLVLRFIIAVFGIWFIIFITHWGFIPFFLLITVIVVIGVLEWFSLMAVMGYKPLRILGMCFTLLIMLSFFANGIGINIKHPMLIVTSAVITMFIIIFFIAGMFRKSIDALIIDVSMTFFGVFYIAWMLGHFIGLREMALFGEYYVYLAFCSVWALDSAAYFIGMKYGKHKLIPGISPNKSVEGAVAGFAASIIVVCLAKLIVIKYMTFGECLIIGSVIGIVGQFGDFAESVIKRNAGVKDSGRIVLGHGGVLDRFDSLIFVVPTVYYILKFLSR